MSYPPFYHPAWVLFLGLALGTAADAVWAQNIVEPARPAAAQPDQPETLRQSLDVVISTLENDQRRQALLEQLRTLRNNVGAAGELAAKSTDTTDGLLGALANSLNREGKLKQARDFAFGAWLAHAQAARANLQALLNDTSRAALRSSLVQIAVGLSVWLILLLLLAYAGRALFARYGWPLTLPPEPRPWRILVHFLRRVLPALLTFAGLLISMGSLDTTNAARAVVLVAAYATLCARVLTTIVDIVISLFTSGHRRVAVALLHRNALKPLFVIGALVALSDAVGSDRLTALLGAGLATWLSETASLIAALISGWLVLRVRRPVQHLIGNRSYARRVNPSRTHGLTLFIANLWHIPALFVIGASVIAVLLTGGATHIAFGRAIVCGALLVLALIVSDLLRRHRRRATHRMRIHTSLYIQRLSRFGYALIHALVWLVFAALCAYFWGFPVLGIGESDALSSQIGRAVMAIGLTALLAWLFWIVLDTALGRALGGGRRKRGKATARSQTVVPLLRYTLFFTIMLIASITALANLGVNVTPLLAGAGIVGLAVGFGAQTLVQDLITGVFIVVEDSLAVGDFVEINRHMGTVEGLNLRTVRLRDLDGVLHFITFSHISSIHNMSRQFGIALLKIRIPHDLPIDEAIALMYETVAQLRKDWKIGPLIRSPLEMQGIHAFEDGCPILRMRLRTTAEWQWDVGRAFNLQLKRLMEARYVNLGAPRISVHMESERARISEGDPNAEAAQQPDLPAAGET